MTDEVTGLVWQQTAPANPCPADGTGICTWAHAQTYCQSLSLGGLSSGWQVPTLPQLFSLVDLGTDPTIDAVAFPGTPNDGFWTASPDGNGTNWYMSFSNGVAYGNVFTNPLYVRCVH